jgi:signal peptidase I
LIIPGLGQIYAGAWRAGVFWLAGYLVCALVIRVLMALLPPTPASLSLAGGVAVIALLLAICAAIRAGRLLAAMRELPPRPWYRSAWFTFVVILAIGVLQSLTLSERWLAYSIPSLSNLPTLTNCDYVFVDAATGGHLPSRGEMVVFHLPRDPATDFVKRVIGLPGDKIQLRNGVLIINGHRVIGEPNGTFTLSNGDSVPIKKETLPDGAQHRILKMTSDGFQNNTPEYSVPADSVFVLGDNRDNSIDSRFSREQGGVGFVPLDHVVGRAAMIYWSCDRSRILSRVE